MYQLVTVEDEIAVPPTKFNLDLEQAVAESLAEKFEGRINPDIGVILAVTSVDSVGEGRILPGDPSVHYQSVFKVLSWMPREHEIVEGEVIDITEFGAFIRAGALDGLVHISQVMDDFVSYDDKNSQLVGRQSKHVLKQGDAVRARIISISFKEQSKVGLTMRQPFLGSLKWLTEKAKEEKKVKKEEKKAEKEEEKK
ncbi:MAG: DNA-directed RNA polymerase [Candidatus Aenigmatarchaeota archaeon]|nr:DNA-directed RNA polymerase [Candidatus Aenigmarchaeota archaeon]